MENNFNYFEENNNEDGGGLVVLVIVISFFLIFISTVLILLRTGKLNGFISRISQNNPGLGNFLNGIAGGAGSPGGSSPAGTPAGTPGSRRGGPTAPTQASIAADAEQSTMDQILDSLGADADMIVASVGLDIAGELARNQKGIAKFIMKRGMKAPGSKTLFQKGAKKLISKTFTGKIKSVFQRLTAKAASKLGARWAKTSANLGRSAATISAAAARQVGTEGAELAARLAAERAAMAAARQEATLSLGPIGVLYDAVTVVGIGLDVANAGNFAQLTQTSDLLQIKKSIDREVQNVNIACTTVPPTADCPTDPEEPAPPPDPDAEPKAGRYPSFFGPLDKEQSDDYTAFYQKLTDKVVDIVTTQPYTPRVQALFTRCNTEFGAVFAEAFREAGLDPDTVEIPEITDDQFSEIFLAYWTDADSDYFYDLAFDALCADAGGVTFTPGEGYDRQCTYKTEAECHAQYPWPPPADDSQDLTYTEWRAKDWFNRFKNTDGSNTLNMTAIPEGGACIVASPGLHQLCDKEETTGGGLSGVRAKNNYIRNTGECVNSPEMCSIKGVSFTNAMDPGSMAWLTDHPLPSCYTSDAQRACENMVSVTVCRAIESGADARGAQALMDLNISTGNAVTDALADQAEGLAAAVGGGYNTLREATQQAFAVMAGGQQTYTQIQSGLQDVVNAANDNLTNLADRAAGGSVTAALALPGQAVLAGASLTMASIGSAISALDTAVALSRTQNWPDPVWCHPPTCRWGEDLYYEGEDWRSCSILRCVCQSGNITNNMCCPKFHTGSMVNGQAICTPDPYPDWWNTFVAGSCTVCRDEPTGTQHGIGCQFVPGHWENTEITEESCEYDEYNERVCRDVGTGKYRSEWWPEYTWCQQYVNDTQQVCTPAARMPRDPRDGFATREDYCMSGMTTQEAADADQAAADAAQAAADRSAYNEQLNAQLAAQGQ